MGVEGAEAGAEGELEGGGRGARGGVDVDAVVGDAAQGAAEVFGQAAGGGTVGEELDDGEGGAADVDATGLVPEDIDSGAEDAGHIDRGGQGHA